MDKIKGSTTNYLKEFKKKYKIIFLHTEIEFALCILLCTTLQTIRTYLHNCVRYL